jgi:hypothetical protein
LHGAWGRRAFMPIRARWPPGCCSEPGSGARFPVPIRLQWEFSMFAILPFQGKSNRESLLKANVVWARAPRLRWGVMWYNAKM